jgi:hypothetical protein
MKATPWEVISIDGKSIEHGTLNNGTERIEMSSSGLFVIRIGNAVFKTIVFED